MAVPLADIRSLLGKDAQRRWRYAMNQDADVRPSDGLALEATRTLPASRLLLLGALTALAPMSVDIHLPSIPAMAEALGVQAGTAQLSVSLFLVGLALGQIICGPLADRYGRRPVLLGGLALYLLGTAVCMRAEGIETMLCARALQALGASAGAVLVRAVIRDLCRGRAIAHALSTTAAIMMVLGPISGPLLGSALLAWQGWRSVFWVMLGAGIVCIVLARLMLEETKAATEHTTRSDWLWGLRGYGLALRHRPLRGYLACEAIVATGMFTYVAMSPFVFIRHLGASPTVFAALFSSIAVGWALGTAISGYAVTRLGTHALLRVGLVLLCLGSCALLALVLMDIRQIWAFGAVLFVAIGPGVMLRANFTALGMEGMPRAAGTASALFGATGLLSGGLVSGAVSALGATGPLPMAGIMLSSALGAGALYLCLQRAKPADSD